MSQRGEVLQRQANVTLVFEDCVNCGVVFAIPEELRAQRVYDHKRFYCPNGHNMVYTGKTEAEKLQERLDRTNQMLTHEQNRNESLKRQHAVTKGKLTKTRNRIGNGVCPCCGRTFANVAAHMKTNHPDYLKEH